MNVFKVFACACFAFASSLAFSFHVKSPLIGGQPSEDYPEVIYIQSGNARCSATVVSPRGEMGVILTAGHCVVNEGEISPVFSSIVKFRVRNEVFMARCKQNPLYKSDSSQDMSLCKANAPIDVDGASIASKGPKIDDEVMLGGYGCISGDDGGSGGNDGIYRIGKAHVIQEATQRDNWFYTKVPDATLCFGDSGGAAFAIADKHMVIGVNSRGDIKELSLLSAVYSSKARKFFKDFAVKEGVKICGVNASC